MGLHEWLPFGGPEGGHWSKTGYHTLFGRTIPKKSRLYHQHEPASLWEFIHTMRQLPTQIFFFKAQDCN